MERNMQEIVEKVACTLVEAGSTFRQDKKDAYRKAIAEESNPQAKWVMETILKNAEAAERQKSPLCDDTGIPHLVLDVGEKAILPLLTSHGFLVHRQRQHVGSFIHSIHLLHIITDGLEHTEIVEPDGIRTPLPTLNVGKKWGIGRHVDDIGIALDTCHVGCLQ